MKVKNKINFSDYRYCLVDGLCNLGNIGCVCYAEVIPLI